MRRLNVFVAILLAGLVAAPAWAGSGGKCTHSTQECLDYMANKMKGSGWVGLELNIDETTGVATILKVVAGSPAEKAQMNSGDILFALNGVEIKTENQEALDKIRADMKPGTAVTYTVRRAGEDHQMAITLAPMPADLLARYIGEHMMEHASAETAASKES